MANTKISALTPATTPVGGTEVLPIVQSSTTVKVSIANLTPGLDTITAAKGGTGQTAYTAGDTLYASGSTALSKLGIGTTDYVMTSSGSAPQWSASLKAKAGGTGQTSFAVGDLLYADTTTTLAKLPDVATGNALISGGVGVAPSWGQIGLTTHVSGTLPVANGGTNLTSFTANGVVYASSSSALTTGSSLVFDGTNLGVGIASPVRKLHIYNNADGFTSRFTGGSTSNVNLGIFESTAGGFASIGTESNHQLRFFTNGVDALVLDTSLNVLMGTTDSSVTAGVGYKFIYSATDPYMGIVQNSSTSGANNYHLYSAGAGAFRFFVDLGGTIHATSTSIAAISDASLKTNIKDLETGLTEVMALKPRRFDWINGDATNVAGFIAQEVEQILPELVMESMYTYDENGDEIKKKNLKMGDILPTLVKAIQEQQALIQSLTDRLTILERS